jgi:hypothetical protein
VINIKVKKLKKASMWLLSCIGKQQIKVDTTMPQTAALLRKRLNCKSQLKRFI